MWFIPSRKARFGQWFGGPWFWWEIPSKVGGVSLQLYREIEQHRGTQGRRGAINIYCVHARLSSRRWTNRTFQCCSALRRQWLHQLPGSPKRKREGMRHLWHGRDDTKTRRLAGWQRLHGETFWRRKQPQPSPSNDQLKAILLPRAGEDSKWGLRGAAPGRALHDNWWEGEAGGGSPIPPLTMVIRYSESAR